MLVNANFRIPKTGSHYEGEIGDTDYWEKKTKPDVVTRKHEKNLCKKKQLLEQVKVLYTQGLSQSNIAKELGILRTSVWRYLKSGFNPNSAHYDQKRESKIKAYEETINSMLAKRNTFKEKRLTTYYGGSRVTCFFCRSANLHHILIGASNLQKQKLLK